MDPTRRSRVSSCVSSHRKRADDKAWPLALQRATTARGPKRKSRPLAKRSKTAAATSALPSRDDIVAFLKTAKGKIGRFLKLLAPGLVEKMALAALKQEVRPH